jgi:hypothetical protein
MNRIMKGAVAATALVGVAAAAPTEASANPLIIAPALAVLLFGGVAVGGAVVGASIANSSHPRGRVMVSDATAPGPAAGPPPPAPGQMSEGPVAGPMVADASSGRPCYPTRAKLNGVWHDIEVCD